MQFVSLIWSRIFNSMPYPIRLVMNLAALPFVLLYWLPKIIFGNLQDGAGHAISNRTIRDKLQIEAISRDEHDFEAAIALATKLSHAQDWDTLQKQVETWEQAARSTHHLQQLYRAALIGGRRNEDGTDAVPSNNGWPQSLTTLDLSAFERLALAQSRRPNDPILAAVTARAAIEIGWALRGDGFADDIPHASIAPMTHYFETAEQILAPFTANGCTSATLLLVQHMSADGLPNAGDHLRRSYEAWRKAAPKDIDMYAQHAFKLLPRWFGDYDELEVTARQAAADTQSFWGAGAYAAFYLGVLECDSGAVYHVDKGFLGDGFDDLIKAHKGDQILVNRILSSLANASSGEYGQGAKMAQIRSELRTVFHSIVKNHLTHFCTASWNMRPLEAKSYIAETFADELAAGHTVKFTNDGIEIVAQQ